MNPTNLPNMNPATGLPNGVLYFGPKYLWTIDELEKNAVLKLGSMNDASYENFEARMLTIAQKAQIVHPILAIGIKFKEGANAFVSEQPYPILKEEWTKFKEDAKTMCEFIPNVYVVDGSRFTLPI